MSKRTSEFAVDFLSVLCSSAESHRIVYIRCRIVAVGCCFCCWCFFRVYACAIKRALRVLRQTSLFSSRLFFVFVLVCSQIH